MNTGIFKLISSPVLVFIFLLGSVLVNGQKLSTGDRFQKSPHVELTGLPTRDSVSVDEVLKSGGIRSIDTTLAIVSFRYLFIGPCIGAKVFVACSDSDRFRKGDTVYFKYLTPGDKIRIYDVLAKGANGTLVSLQTSNLVITK